MTLWSLCVTLPVPVIFMLSVSALTLFDKVIEPFVLEFPALSSNLEPLPVTVIALLIFIFV